MKIVVKRQDLIENPLWWQKAGKFGGYRDDFDGYSGYGYGYDYT